MPDPRNNRIDYIEVPVRDIEASKAFFRALCGWEFTDWGPDYASFNDGRVDGGFRRATTTAVTDEGSVLIVLYFDDLDATVERVEELGGKITKPVFSFPGGRRFHFTDPSGNEFAVWSEEK